MNRSPLKSPARKKVATMPNSSLREKSSSPYKLRDTSKLPSRYRDEEIDVPPLRGRTPVKQRTPSKNAMHPSTNSSARRVLNTSTSTTPSYHSLRTSVHLQENVSPTSSLSTQRTGNIADLTKISLSGSDSNSGLKSGEMTYPSIHNESGQMQSNSYAAPTVVTRHSGYQQHSKAVARVVEESYANTPESSRSSFDDDASEATRNALLKKIARHARRWVICEFFYSGVDEQLFLGDNEFRQLIREAFPNLKTTLMNKQEWRVIRRLLGKPRRCSTTFFDEERQILDQRRRKVRGIYDGSYTMSANCDLSDMPPNLPAPLVVGMKVYARLRTPKDGIYGGTIDALVSGGGGYRIVFDKEDMIPPAFVPDSEVMYDGSLELLSLSYFLQQNHARLPSTVTSGRTDEKVGNFPVRMLVILVKVAKLLEIKKKLVKTLTELNNEAERESILTDVYTPVFQERYARTVVDLETVNRQINIYLNGIQEYNTQLLPQLSEVSISARPEALRRMCASHANQIVKHCNQGLNVTNAQALKLITALTSLLLQIRSLGQQKMTPMDLTALNDSINEIHQMISPKNYNCFQDHVEVHMRQVHNVMLKSGAIVT
ncbi:dirp [Dictyocaulus viviparus]|uniref:Dirp n=1 Tax=Dictyocaulus viviparus TaxID=29172 RepID=A0A0D8XR42_DICVI|nr:dirp [Dictyocaulus viviparus]